MGIELSARAATSSAEQIEFTKRFFSKGVDALIIGPIDSTDPELAALVEDILSRNIPVIAVGTEILNTEVTSTIRTDNFKGGEAAADFLIEKSGGEGSIILIDSPEKLPRIEGFRHAINNHPGCNIVYEAKGDWTDESAIRIVREGLATCPNVNGIFAASDPLALAAADLVMEMGLSDAVTVVGFDGLPEVLVALQDGRMGATINQLPATVSTLAIDTARRLVNGEKVPSQQLIETQIITKDNLLTASLDILNLLPDVLQGMVTGNKELSVANTALKQENIVRKQAEEELIESRKMLNNILDTIPVRVFWKDLESVYLGCNASFARDAGDCTPQEIVGRTDFDFGWTDTQGRSYREDDRDVMETGRAKINYEETMVSQSGHTSWLTTSKVPLRNNNGDIYGVLGTYEDITERKEADRKLRHNEENLRTTLNSIGDAVIATDTQGNITRINPVAENLTGWTLDEAIQQPLTKVFNIVNAQTGKPVITPGTASAGHRRNRWSCQPHNAHFKGRHQISDCRFCGANSQPGWRNHRCSAGI